jgi:hypothetical protein
MYNIQSRVKSDKVAKSASKLLEAAHYIDDLSLEVEASTSINTTSNKLDASGISETHLSGGTLCTDEDYTGTNVVMTSTYNTADWVAHRQLVQLKKSYDLLHGKWSSGEPSSLRSEVELSMVDCVYPFTEIFVHDAPS